MASSVGGQRRSSKALPKAKLAPQNGHGHCLGVCCQSEPLLFWIVMNPLHLRSMLSKSKRCMENLNAGTGQQKGPNSPPRPRLAACSTVSASKVAQTGLKSFASSAIFTWPLANRIPVLWASQQLFTGKMAPRPAGGRKCFPRVRQIPKDRFLCYRNKQTFVVGKNKFTVMVPILINKDVLKLSYNDLKSNHNCFRTNLNISAVKSTSKCTSGTLRTRQTETWVRSGSSAPQRQLWPEPQRSQGLWFLLLTRGLRSTWEGERGFGPRCHTKPDNPKAATSMEETPQKQNSSIDTDKQHGNTSGWILGGQRALYRSHNHSQILPGFRGLHAGYRCP